MRSLIRRLIGNLSESNSNSENRKPAEDRNLETESLEPRMLFTAAPVDAPGPDGGGETQQPQAAEESVVVTAAAAQETAAAVTEVESVQEVATPTPAQPGSPADQTGSGQNQNEATPQPAGETAVPGNQEVTLVEIDQESAQLNRETLEAIAEAAAERWRETGLSEEQIAILDSIEYRIQDFGDGKTLGASEGIEITVDDNGSGKGWFADDTPLIDEEFGESGQSSMSEVDLLSVILHEQGHILGAEHSDEPDDLMNEILLRGERRVPVEGQAESAIPGEVTETEFIHAAITTRTWTGGGDGTSWNQAANWGGTVPAAGEEASFSGAGPTTIDLGGGTVSVGAIHIESGDWTFADGALDVTANTVRIDAGGELTLNAAVAGNADFELDGGNLNFEADLSAALPDLGGLSADPDLALWLDARDPLATGTAPANGSTVTVWHDKSGNNRDADALNGDGPVFIAASSASGAPAIQFTNDMLNTTFNFNALGPDYTILAVSRYTGGDNERVIGSRSENYLLGHHGNRVGRFYANGWVDFGTTADNNFHQFTVINGPLADGVAGGGPLTDWWMDGVQRRDNHGGANDGDYKPGQISVGGGSGGTGERSNSEVSQLVIFNRALSTADRVAVEAWLAQENGGGVAADFSDNSITVLSDSSINLGAGLGELDADNLTIGSGVTLDVNSSLQEANIEFTGTTLQGGTATVNANGQAAINLNTVSETAASNLAIGGDGSVSLPNANSYIGTTTVGGSASLKVQNTASLGGGGTTVNTGAALVLEANNVAENVTLNGGGNSNFSGALVDRSSSTIDFLGTINVASSAKIQSGNGGEFDLNGAIIIAPGATLTLDADNRMDIDTTITGDASTALLVTGGGDYVDLHVSNPNFAGTITVQSQGRLDGHVAQAFGTGDVRVMGNDASVFIRNGHTHANNFFIEGDGRGTEGAIRSEGNSNTITGLVTLTGNADIFVNNSNLTLTQGLAGAFTLNKTGANNLSRLILQQDSADLAGFNLNHGQARLQTARGLGNTTTIDIGATQAVEFDFGAIGPVTYSNSPTDLNTFNVNDGKIEVLSGEVTLADTFTINLNILGDIFVGGDGTLNVETAFGNGGGMSDADFLNHYGFDRTGDDRESLNLHNNGGMLNSGSPTTYVDFTGEALLTSGPRGNGLNFDSDADFINTGAIDQGDNYKNLFIGYLNTTETGVFQFRNSDRDDWGTMFVDLDQDGVFESNTGNLGSNNGEQLAWVDNGTKSVTLTNPQGTGRYLVAFTHLEGGGGSRTEYSFKLPSMAAQEVINPGDPAQAGLWTGFAAVPIDNNVHKVGTGTTTFSADNTYNGDTRVNAGTLVVETSGGLGTADGGTFVDPGATLALSGAVSNLTIGDALTISGTGAAGQSGALVNLDGDNEITGTIAGIGIETGIDSDADTLTLSNTVDMGIGSVVFDGVGDINVTGVMQGSATAPGLVAPDAIGGLEAWYDASTLTATHNDGDAVTAWADQSSNGRDLVKYTGTPTFAANEINNLPAVRFNANNENLQMADPSNEYFAGDVYLVFRSGDGTTTFGPSWGAPIGVKDGGDADRTWMFQGGEDRFWSSEIPAAVTRNGVSIPSANNFDMSATTGNASMGDYMVLQVAAGPNNGTQIREYIVGTRTDAWANSRFDTAEVIAFDHRLSDNERIAVEAYLADKYAITGSFGVPAFSNDIMKQGSGTVTLTGDNTYAGETTVTEGTLIAGADTALGTGDAGTTVADGAVLSLTGGITIADEAITLNGNGAGAGALVNLSGDNAVSATSSIVAEAVSTGEIGIGVADAGDTLTIGADIDLQFSKLTTFGAGDITVDGVISGLTASVLDPTFEETVQSMSPVAFYTFDNMLDADTANNDGSSTKTASFQGGGSLVPGRHGDGMAIGFNTSNRLEVDGGNIDLPTGDWTIGMWFNDLHGTGDWRTLFRGQGGDHHVIVESPSQRLGIYSNSNGAFRDSGYSVDGSRGGPDVTSGWHFLAATGHSAGTGSTDFYIDGSKVGTADRTSTTDIWRIGNWPTQSSADVIDNAFVFTTALTDTDIQDMWDARDGVGVLVPDNNLMKMGTGTLTLTSDNTYTDDTTVMDGTLLANNGSGSATGSGDVTVKSGGELGGTGTVTGAVTVENGGEVNTGDSGPGTLAAPNVTFVAGSEFEVELNGTTASSGHDQLASTGTVDLGGATFDASVGGTYTPGAGDTLTLITATTALTGTFGGIADGDTVLIDGNPFKMDYQANAVVLTYDAMPILDIDALGAPEVNNQIQVANNGGNIELTVDGTVVFSTALTNLTSLDLNGGEGDDTFTLDYSGGLGSLPVINIDGGGNAGGIPGGDGDVVVIENGSFGTVIYNADSGDSGDVDLDGNGAAEINYAGLEPVIMTGGTITDLIVNFAGGFADVAILEDNGVTPGDGSSRLRTTSGTAETFTFTNPTGSLTINLGAGNDDLTIASDFSSGSGAGQFNADLTIDGEGDTDSVTVDAALDLPGSAFDVTAETINLDSGSVTTGGDQSYTGGTVLGADTTLGGANVTFNGTVDSDGTARSLSTSVTGTLTFGDHVGATSALSALDTGATGATKITGSTVLDNLATGPGSGLILNFDASFDPNTADNLVPDLAGAVATGALGGGPFSLLIDDSPAVTFASNPSIGFAGITGTYVLPGALGGSTDSQRGQAGLELQTNGADESPSDIDHAALGVPDVDASDATFEFWIKPTDLTGDEVIWETGGGTGTGFALEDSELVFRVIGQGGAEEVRYDLATDGANANALGGTAPTADFFQVTGTIQTDATAATIELFVNGTSLGSLTGDAITDWDGGDPSGLGTVGGSNLGGYGSGSLGFRPFDGQISVWRLYSGVLAQADIQTNFNAVQAGGQTEITITTTGDQTFGNAVSLGIATAVEGNDVTFDSTVDADPASAAPGALTVNTTGGGVTDFNGVIGGSTALGGLTTNADGTATLDTSAITSTGAIIIGENATASGNIAIDGAAVTFGGTSDFNGTATVDAIDATFTGDAAFDAPADLNITDDLDFLAAATFNSTSDIDVSDNATFTGAVTIGGAATVNANDITYSSTVDSSAGTNQSLTLTATGTGVTTLNGAVGGNDALDSLVIGGGSRIDIGAGTIVVDGAGTLTFNTAVSLTSNLLITDDGAGDVTFNSTIDGAFALTVNTPGGGETFFKGNVGGSTALTTLTTDNNGVAEIGGPSLPPNGTLFLNFDADNETAGTSTLFEGTPGANVNERFNMSGAGITFGPAAGTVMAGIQNAYNFNGTSGGVGGNFEALSGNPTDADASFEFWVRPTSATATGLIFEAGGAGAGSSFVYDGAAGEVVWTVDPNTANIPQLRAALPVDGEFHQIFGVYDRDLGGLDVFRLYVDGVELASDNSSNNTNDWAGSDAAGLGAQVGAVGETTPANTPFEGDIAKFRLYSNAIGAAGILNNYNAVVGHATTVTTTGGQSYGGAVELASNVATSGNDITFAATVDSSAAGGEQSLTVNTTGGGVTTFTGEVGATNELGDLTTNFDGRTVLSANVVSNGDTTFGDAVVLGADLTITQNSAAGTVLFASTVDAASGVAANLTVNTPNGATTQFGGDVGSDALGALTNDAGLASITTDAPGATTFAPLATVLGGATLSYDASIADGTPTVWEGNADSAQNFVFTAATVLNPVVGNNTRPGITDAYTFDGTDGALNTGLDNIPGNPSDASATWEFWVRPDAAATGIDRIYESGGSGNGMSIALDNATGEVTVVVDEGSNQIVVTGGSVTPGDFHQIAMVYERDASGTTDRLELFVNGVSVGSGTGAVNDWDGGDTATLAEIGTGVADGTPGGAGNFLGDMAIFRFYESALGSGEVGRNFYAVAGVENLTISAATTGDQIYNDAVTLGANASLSAETVTMGSTADLQDNDLTIDVSDTGTDSSIADSISGTGGLIKQGAATLVLSGDSTYSGDTTVEGGTLRASNTSGSATGTGTTTAQTGTVIDGNGAVGALITESGALVQPGVMSIATLGAGDFTAEAGSTLELDLEGGAGAGLAGGHDQLQVTGTVTLNNSELDLLIGTSFTAPAAGTEIVLIDNDGVDPVTGEFNGFPDGTIITLAIPNPVTMPLPQPAMIPAQLFEVDYQGGDGNDVSLVVLAATATTNIWVDGMGNLKIDDIDGATSADNLTIRVDGTEVVITDPGNALGTLIPGAVQTSVGEVRVDTTLFTGDIMARTLSGDDHITVGDLGASVLPGGIMVDGGDGFDNILYTGVGSVLTSGSNASFTGEEIDFQFSDLTTTDGNITLDGTGGSGGTFVGVELLDSDLTINGTGSVTLNGSGGDAGNSNHGVYLLHDSDISTTNGNIDIDGSGGGDATGVANKGVMIFSDSSLSAGGGGAITIDGTAGAGILQNEGVFFMSGTSASVVNGDMTITGTGSSTIGGGLGVSISGTMLTGTGTGDINISGTSAATGGFNNGGVQLWGTDVDTTGTGSGSVTISGSGAAGGTDNNMGVRLSTVNITTGGDASIDLDGTGAGSGANNMGVQLSSDANLTVSGTGTISIDGTGGNGTYNNDGVELGQNSDLEVANGNLTISGTGNGGFGSQGLSGSGVTMTGTGIGNILLTGTSNAAGSSNQGISLASTAVSTAATGSGTITLTGTGSAASLGSNEGVILSATALSTGGNAAIEIDGVGGGTASGTNNTGVRLLTGSTVAAGGSGAVTIDGTGGDGLLFNHGVSISGAGSAVTSGSGNITIEGTARGTYFNYGIEASFATIDTGGGDISMTGTSVGAANGLFNTGINLLYSDVGANAGNVTIGATGGLGSSFNEGFRMVGGSLSGTLSLVGMANGGTTGFYNSGVYILSADLGGAGGTITGTGGGGLGFNHGIYMLGGTPFGGTLSGSITDGNTATSLPLFPIP